VGIFDFIKFAIMKPLQQQVVERGVCPKCHKKTLRHVHTCEHFSSWQCTKCLHVYMLEPSAEGKEGEPQ
jgi:ribosomal protein L37AE/L43A